MATIVETYETNMRVMKQNSEMLQEILRQVKLLSAHLGIADEGEIDEAREMEKDATFSASSGNRHIENLVDYGLTDNIQQTDTSIDVETDHQMQLLEAQHGPIMVDLVDQKTFRTLAQTREVARKSRLKGNGRLRLTELEQELQRVLQQGNFTMSGLFNFAFNSLNDFLYGKSYIYGNKLSKDDIKVYAAILKNLGDTFLNISKWYNVVYSQLVTSFPVKAVDVGFGDKVALDELFKANAADDNDDMDLFGMKLCRKRDILEEKFSNAFIWYDPEESHFVVELTYNYEITSYDIRTGYWHFAMVTQIVYKMVEEVHAKGGNITRECGPVKGETSIISFMKDHVNCIFELIQRAFSHEPLCQVMLCVDDLDRSVKFYEKALGMKLVMKVDKPKYKSSISMEGHAKEQKFVILVLTCNSSVTEYTKGNAKVELEPIFMFLPFHHGCYNNLQKSISKVAGSLHISSHQISKLADHLNLEDKVIALGGVVL
ncbi:hypothetical protein V6N12_024612 [Hibiscus sabdariffa]|uniref:VOC domain-containing protein n=1 Tax=Hibiscus sabdariffa TaxID=183260 RepID=A0ABR2G1X3_9ROSI